MRIAGTLCYLFFFNDTATTEIYTLSLHDALPIFCSGPISASALAHTKLLKSRLPLPLSGNDASSVPRSRLVCFTYGDRKSTRLNSSHANISYAVFCLKKNEERSVLAEQRTR